jgi:hypothetical protein
VTASNGGNRGGAAVARAVADVAEGIFVAISDVAVAYRDRWVELGSGRRAVTAGELETLRDLVHERLRAAEVVHGCGVVVAPGLLHDASRHLVWWERGSSGAPKRLVLDLDPTGEDSYDYPSMSWFTVPRDEGRRAVLGPYVDFRGANRYVYTFAVPVRVGGTFLGVAGADVSVQDLEPALLAALKPLAADAVVVASDRRVVVANSGRWSVGSRLRSFPEAGVDGFVSVHPVCDDLGWVVAVSG